MRTTRTTWTTAFFSFGRKPEKPLEARKDTLLPITNNDKNQTVTIIYNI